MKIVHGVHGFAPEFRGGTEGYVGEIAARQVAAGHEVTVLTGTSETAARARVVASDPTATGVRVHRLVRYGLCGDRWDHTDAPHAERPVDAWLRRTRPDVLHLHHFVRLTRSTARIAARAGIPVVWTFHDLSTTCPCFNRVDAAGRFHAEPLDPAAMRTLVEAPAWLHPEEIDGDIAAYRADLRAEVLAATTRIAPSVAQADRIAALLDVPRETITAIPHGTLVDAPTIRPPASAPVGDPLRLVHWGAFYRDKGEHVLIDAVRAVEAAAPGRVRLTLFGEPVFPAYGEALRAAASGLPITFAGAFTPDRLDAADFDVAVFPTLAHESHSFVIDEAFQRGWPVLASDLGALPERIGAAGRTVAPNDANALAAAIREALDPASVRRWRAAIPASLPSMTEHAARLVEHYADAVRRGAMAATPPPVSAARLLRERQRVNRVHELARLAQALA